MEAAGAAHAVAHRRTRAAVPEEEGGAKIKIWKISSGECVNTFENQIPYIDEIDSENVAGIKHSNSQQQISRSISCDKIKKNRRVKKNSITSLQLVSNV